MLKAEWAGEGMHKHEWIRGQLLEDISKLPADSRLPDERDLAERFAVSRATVRQALAALVAEDRIYAIRGRGTFVSSEPISKGLQLTSFSEDMHNRGLEPSTRLLLGKQVVADAKVAKMLELAPGSKVIHLERLRLADGFPMALESIWLPARLYPELLKENLEQSLYGVLEARYRVRIVRAEQKIAAIVMDERARDLLAMPPHSAALVVTRRGFDEKGRVAEYGRSAYRADRYDFDVSIQR